MKSKSLIIIITFISIAFAGNRTSKLSPISKPNGCRDNKTEKFILGKPVDSDLTDTAQKQAGIVPKFGQCSIMGADRGSKRKSCSPKISESRAT